MKAPPPAGDSVGVAAKFLGDLLVGGVVGLSTAEDEACPEGQALGGGAGTDQLLQQGHFPKEQLDA